MRISFLIERKNYYRLLGPVIDRALHEGLEVECWHDYAQPRGGAKYYEFPSVEAAPNFRNGKCKFRTYLGADGLKKLLKEDEPDVVLAVRTPLTTLGTSTSVKWLTVHTLDFPFDFEAPHGILSSSLSALYSEFWCEFGIEFSRRRGLLEPGNEESLRARMIAVGCTEMDQISLIDRSEVRTRLGIPEEQRVVVLLPYPVASAPQTFWSRRVYAEPNRTKQLLNVMLHRRFEYWSNVLKGWHDANVVKAVRRFCNRSEAYLVVKSRLKDPIPAYTQRLADRCIYDESHYPATILEVLSIADLCIHFYSWAVTEAAYLGVPNVCVVPEDCSVEGMTQSELFFDRREGGLFDFRGVSRTITVAEAIEDLPKMSLAEFQMDAAARSAYVKKFLGYDDGQASKRVLDAAASLAS